jgi:hypothetical protein
MGDTVVWMMFMDGTTTPEKKPSPAYMGVDMNVRPVIHDYWILQD